MEKSPIAQVMRYGKVALLGIGLAQVIAVPDDRHEVHLILTFPLSEMELFLRLLEPDLISASAPTML